MSLDSPALDRRAALGLASLLGAIAAADSVQGAPVAPAEADVSFRGRALRIVDLTHELTEEFNITPPRTRLAMQPIDGSGAAVGMKLNLLSLVEHTGTHIDAPRHFSETGRSLGEIPVGDLVVPLAILDLKAKARLDRNAAVQVDDILAWERRHGALPKGCCVALNSGWSPLQERKRASSLPASEARKAPGFSPEAAAFLIDKRSVKGIATDAMSLDTGSNGPAYPAHQAWLRSGRWGIEGLTNMDAVPQGGAILVLGAAPLRGGTGFPVRAIALY